MAGFTLFEVNTDITPVPANNHIYLDIRAVNFTRSDHREWSLFALQFSRKYGFITFFNLTLWLYEN